MKGVCGPPRLAGLAEPCLGFGSSKRTTKQRPDPVSEQVFWTMDHGAHPYYKMSQSNRELVVDFLSYKLSQKGYSWSQFSDVEENRTEAPEGTESDMETPSAINGNASWHLADSPAVNGATGHSRSSDAREVIPMAAVKQALRDGLSKLRPQI
uniref:Apoptosis regulator Bcl-2 family BH4 domain-containing protein n=1 Tax=Bos mutus grunniens TaxID=30521 RepID=A0A8B9XXC8_BOSMU